MRLTPLDIREQQFRRVMRGLDPEEVEAFLASVATEFEALVSGNNELRQRVVELEEKIHEYRSMEKALRDTLLTAEKVMGDAKEGAQREATLIIREAEMASQRTKARLHQELAQLQHEVAEVRRAKDAYFSRVRWLLRAHLELIDGHAQEFGELDQGLGMAAPPTPASAPAPAPQPQLPPAHPPAPRADWGPSPPAVPPRSEWSGPATATPGAHRGEDLAESFRPVSPDGAYGTAPVAYPPPAVPGYASAPGAGPGGPPSRGPAEDIARAAQRAERLAAEARAALERHGGGPGGPSGWTTDRARDGLDPRT